MRKTPKSWLLMAFILGGMAAFVLLAVFVDKKVGP